MEHTIIDLSQKSEQWKSWRRNYIGASDAPVIQEVSPWKTILQLWEEKIEGKDVEENSAMRRGSELEGSVRLEVSKEHYAAYKPVCMQSTRHEWMVASLDGWDSFSDYPLIEIKCPSFEAHKQAISGEIPGYYFPQLQHQMVVAGVDEALYVSYNDKFDEKPIVSIPVKKENEYCKYLIEREYRFWESLNNFEPPEPSDKDMKLIADSDALWMATDYVKLSAQIKELEKKEKELREVLISMANHPRAMIGNLKITRIIRQGNVEYSKIPELQGIDLNQYRKKPIESWRISV